MSKKKRADSIIQTERECWATRYLYDKSYQSEDNLCLHHAFEGHANRPLCDKWGLWVWLKPDYHNTSDEGVHNGNTELLVAIQQTAQREFEKRYGHDKFMEVFGKNYLD